MFSNGWMMWSSSALLPISFSTISTPPQSFDFDLRYVFHIMSPLGLPWHPIEKKGQDLHLWLNISVSCGTWDLRTVSLLDKKRLKLLIKVQFLVIILIDCIPAGLSLPPWLIAACYIYIQRRHSTLPPLSVFTAIFLMTFPDECPCFHFRVHSLVEVVSVSPLQFLFPHHSSQPRHLG